MNNPALSPSTELVPTRIAEIGGAKILTVNARELHSFLQVGRVFAAWITERVEKYGFVEGQDFVVFSGSGKNPQGGRPTTDYHISIDMAKELSMVENNEQGRRVRRYFIECERRLHLPVHPQYISPDQVNQIRLAVHGRMRDTGENHATIYNELFRALGVGSTAGILQQQFNHAIHQISSYTHRAALPQPEEVVQAVVERSRFVVQYVDGKPRVNIIPADCWIVTEDNLAKLLRDPAGISRDRLPAIIQAAAQRLAEDV